MRAKATKDGVTLRAMAGTHNVLLAMDLDPAARPGCLGFSIERTDLDSGERRWLPNMIRFASDTSKGWLTTARAPLQAFRWGDYTTTPGHRYRYRAIARKGTPAEIVQQGQSAEATGGADTLQGGVTVEVKTEDTASPKTSVFFNRGAAASKAYNDLFGNADPDTNPAALVWLSRGLEEALLAFLAQAKDAHWALHAVIYEFQKPNLLAALAAAKARGADVQVVFHARCKQPEHHAADHKERRQHGAEDSDTAGSDHTLAKNLDAIKKAKLAKALGKSLVRRDSNPQGAIMHDKYVVLLKDKVPVAVWTGSTNWTDGAIYGQLNVGHAIYDAKTAALYEESFKLLKGDPDAHDSKLGNAKIAPAPRSRDAIPPGITPVFSPQANLDMITLYAEICAKAKLLFVSAPFLLHSEIRDVLKSPSNGALRYVMADKAGTFGSKGEIDLFNGDPGRVGAAATMLKSPLNDFQGKLLEGRESFHHAGVHVHTKIILADPFGPDPILVTGSANFSNGSTTLNDSNSLIIRGDTAIADIYGTEFMRMFQHYWFRYRQGQAPASGSSSPATVLTLKDSDEWQTSFFDGTSTNSRDRVAFIN
jgi:phosphatidylserine/phosphatidylglycerophosphate/cardiolipin synthase-like enzyme